MNKIKTCELEGYALDYYVGKAQGIDIRVGKILASNTLYAFANDFPVYSPSAYWTYGGKIIESNKICLSFEVFEWIASCDIHICAGPTPLIAAMRAYVLYKLGEEVDELI